jgi:CBS domain containing-hemolysin-like protein
MDHAMGEWPASVAFAVTAGAFLLAMLAAGLLAALLRVRGLSGHGLLEEAGTDGALRACLQPPRRFEVTVGSLYLALTVVGCVAAGRTAAALTPGAPAWRSLLVTALIVTLAWTLGGLAGRSLAAGAALDTTRWGARLLRPLHWLLRPWTGLIVWLLDRAGDTLSVGDALPPPLTAGEIRSLLAEEEGAVDLEDEEREMIHSIFGFHGKMVREIMVPRIDMISLDAADPVETAVATVNATLHSRLPIHDGTVDRITGLLYAKDLLALVAEGRLAGEGRVVGDLARPAYFIPESKKIDEVLAEFRHKRIHMAIVIDEYGGTAGLVTLEDVLEEIVGEIEDEFDDRERLYEWLDERTLRVDPKIDLEDLQELLGVPLPAEEGSETLAGLVYQAAGRVPDAGDQVTIADLTVVVEAVEDQRILRVRIVAPEALPGHAGALRAEG